MATKNLSESVVTVLSVCGKALEYTAMTIAAIILLAGMTVFLFNPLIFLPLCLIAPRQAAKSLYKLDIPIYEEFWQKAYGWWVAILPMWWKKYFIQARGIEYYSPSVQVKYYFAYMEKPEDVIAKMTSEGQDMLWQKSDDSVRILLAQNGYQPSVEQLKQLNDVVLSHVLKAYPRYRTISQEVLQLLLNRKMLELFIPFVANNGLSPKMISKVFASNDAELIENTQKALERFSEKQTVVRTQSNGTYGHGNGEEWQLFLDEKKGKSLCLSAECSMNLWQYEYFHKAGFSLSAEAICSFLAGGETEMCKLILNFEPKESFNAKALALIAANPKLKSLQLRAKQADANGNAL